jgi:hypothetical protein
MSKRTTELKLESKSEFVKFIDAFALVNDSFIADITPEKISIITSAADNTLFLFGEYSCDTGITTTINIPDSKKLVRVLENIDTTDLKLKVNTNNIEYNGSQLKFKYHLYEEGFLTKPAISVEKITSFKADITFTLSKAMLQKIFKGSSFATNTNKLYFYTDTGTLYAELTDRAKHNTDSYSLAIADVDFNLEPIPVNINNIRLLSLIDAEIKVNINTQYGVIFITIQTDNIKLTYFINTLIQ